MARTVELNLMKQLRFLKWPLEGTPAFAVGKAGIVWWNLSSVAVGSLRPRLEEIVGIHPRLVVNPILAQGKC